MTQLSLIFRILVQHKQKDLAGTMLDPPHVLMMITCTLAFLLHTLKCFSMAPQTGEQVNAKRSSNQLKGKSMYVYMTYFKVLAHAIGHVCHLQARDPGLPDGVDSSQGLKAGGQKC